MVSLTRIDVACLTYVAAAAALTREDAASCFIKGNFIQTHRTPRDHQERESYSSASVLKRGSVILQHGLWTLHFVYAHA